MQHTKQQRKKTGGWTAAPVATAVATLGALVLPASPAHAAVIAVPCDAAALVDAVAVADASPGEDTLTLTPNCVYTLTRPAVEGGSEGLPRIMGKLTIQGNDATIRRAPDAPQFRLISNWGDLTLDRVTLTGGHAPDGVGTDTSGEGMPGDSGGAIQNWGPLAITDSVISGNRAGSGAPGADATATTGAGRGGLGGFGGGISSFMSTTVRAVTITNTVITGNSSGAGGRGGDATGGSTGGRGGSAGFGGGVESLRGGALRIVGSTISGNVTADGGAGGSGGSAGGTGGDGGGGGVGAGVFLSTQEGVVLNPVIASTLVQRNRAGRGGDAGAPGSGGFEGWAGTGGSGGGIGVFYDTLTLDGSKVAMNGAGGPGAGYFPLPAYAGGVYALSARVESANGAYVRGNRPDNCSPVESVVGCANPRTAPRAYAPAGDRRVEDLALAVRTAAATAR
ncbi:hypothetical protein B0I31_102653 [Saccharothrix carnea]|uniref:Outer membrane repeat protein n=1 Tax=Saccharothrix carnea TaxID=1280637 RepID=A0A2P8IGU2_SACCR|nr:hypothetical protein [Saccharothrix carnea]PSL57674.1 hypothetical protein B0I31_102653 [Saccharothrix carnea]